MTKKLKAELSLLIVTIIWGAGFILTKNGLDSLSTFNFLSIRFSIAFLLCALIFHKKIVHIDTATLKYGSIIGILLFLSYALQTYGIQFTSAAKSGFITGFYVIIVPIIVSIMERKMPDMKNIIGIVLSMAGLTLLSLYSLTGINKGDITVLISAVGFAFQIIAVSHYSSKVDSINVAIVQIGVVALLSTIFTFLFETPAMPSDFTGWSAILITSIFATALSFVIQTTMQKHTTPTNATLIYAAEPVFGAIFAYLIGGELLSNTSLLGCILILLGMVIAEVDISILFKKNSLEYSEVTLEEST